MRDSQVDICENLILMCQTQYSREGINATTPTAAERLQRAASVFTPNSSLWKHSGCQNIMFVMIQLPNNRTSGYGPALHYIPASFLTV